MKEYRTSGIAFRIWIMTATLLSLILSAYLIITERQPSAETFFFSFMACVIGSLPALIALWISLPFIKWLRINPLLKFILLLATVVIINSGYASINILIGIFYHDENAFVRFIAPLAVLLIASYLSILINTQNILTYLAGKQIFFSFNYFTKNKKQYMDNHNLQREEKSSFSNSILFKGLITGGLILLMLIPTLFINNLVIERKERQQEIIEEVSGKWADSQLLSGPFLYVPYNDTVQDLSGKPTASKSRLIIIPSQLSVQEKVIPELRPRSIYKVMLYKSTGNFSGNFKTDFPEDIRKENLDYANAKICFSISDFKGIEEEIVMNVNGSNFKLKPGLPVNDFGSTGVSAPITLNKQLLENGFDFSTTIKIKGSSQLHFLPLASNAKFKMESPWASPSFDGNVLPGSHTIKDTNFVAEWGFNQANLPFAQVVKSGQVNTKNLSFGVTLLQPVDHYAKTLRSVKYAILFIGLTFAMFFIIELMQSRPFHPIQYLLVGFALVVFYTLLLSISEYLQFTYAYLIAAIATVLLISFYAYTHFKSGKTFGIFLLFLSLLYSFIYILITLEDTALLVGSIGLFIVLAIVMFAGRKINWYGKNEPAKIKNIHHV